MASRLGHAQISTQKAGIRENLPGPWKKSRAEKNFSAPRFCFGARENFSGSYFWGNLRRPQYRGFEPPRRSRPQHWNPGGARCLSSASVAQMLAAASIKVMDALFGFLARNDAEWTKRELLGRTWRRDWGMRKFRPKNAFWGTQSIQSP